LTLAARPGSGKNLKGQGGAGAGSVFRNLESGRTFTYSPVGAQKKFATFPVLFQGRDRAATSLVIFAESVWCLAWRKPAV
jgi:hypothetical protein